MKIRLKKNIFRIIVVVVVFGSISIWAERQKNSVVELKVGAERSLSSLLTENDDTDLCGQVAVIMYHHIEEAVAAKKKGFSKLNVTPQYFRKHLEQLTAQGYEFIGPKDLINFFDNGGKLPNKAAMLTFDDGYEDNYRVAWPILREFTNKAVIFSPTGLLNKPDYLSWNNIREMAETDSIYFGNHTWSHHSAEGSRQVLAKEIGLADKSLSQRGLNRELIFAYPYGNPSIIAIETLNDLGYKLAFTTKKGTKLCRQSRLELPRIRGENSKLELN